MFSFHKPKIYRSNLGCCICKAKSSSSRFTDSQKYENEFERCFRIQEKRSDARAGPGTKLSGNRRILNHQSNSGGGGSQQSSSSTSRAHQKSANSNRSEVLPLSSSQANNQASASGSGSGNSGTGSTRTRTSSFSKARAIDTNVSTFTFGEPPSAYRRNYMTSESASYSAFSSLSPLSSSNQSSTGLTKPQSALNSSAFESVIKRFRQRQQQQHIEQQRRQDNRQQRLLARQQQQQQQQQQQPATPTKPTRGRFNLLSPQAAFQAVASRLLPKSQQQQQAQRLPQVDQQKMFNGMQLSPEQQQQQKMFGQQVANFMMQSQQPSMQASLASINQAPSVVPQQLAAAAPVNQPQTHSKASGLFSRLTSGLHSSQHSQQQPLTRTRRSALMPSGDNRGEVGVKKTFIVVTGMDLAFSPSSLSDSELPEILNGHKQGSVMARRVSSDDDEEVIYGVCMPIVSLTFVLTCAFWLIVFLFSFCIYLFIKSRKQQQRRQAFESGLTPSDSTTCLSTKKQHSTMDNTTNGTSSSNLYADVE